MRRGTTHATLSWLHAWHTRDETYSKSLAEVVNAQSRRPSSHTGVTAHHLPGLTNVAVSTPKGTHRAGLPEQSDMWGGKMNESTGRSRGGCF
jgi:hypothetical protein